MTNPSIPPESLIGVQRDGGLFIKPRVKRMELGNSGITILDLSEVMHVPISQSPEPAWVESIMIPPKLR